MSKSEKKVEALTDMVMAAREIRRVSEDHKEYVRGLQKLAAEARKTGESQSHRMTEQAFDYGSGVEALLEALERYEKVEGA